MKRRLLIIIIGIIFAFDILFLINHSVEADKNNIRVDIKINELYYKVDSLEQRINRLESMIESDLLDAKESDNMLENVSDFNSERLLS